MTNTVLFNKMVNDYNELAFTHNYIFGYEVKGVIYMTFTGSEDLFKVCKLDKASRGCGYALRFIPTTDQKFFLMTRNAIALCSSKFFNEECDNSKYNRGEIFEKMVTEYFGQVWVKDNVPFTEDGDITVDGVAYQIKFAKATFCNEKSLANLKQFASFFICQVLFEKISRSTIFYLSSEKFLLFS